MDPRFAHIRDWIFDLDNCLYPANSRLFELIDERMTAYIERLLGCDPVEARRVQKMPWSTATATGSRTVQTGSGIGRHCQYSSSSTRLARST